MANLPGHELSEALDTADRSTLQNAGCLTNGISLMHGEAACGGFLEKKQEGNSFNGSKQEGVAMEKTEGGSSSSYVEMNEQSQNLARVCFTGFTHRRRRSSHRGPVNGNSDSPICLGSSHDKRPKLIVGNNAPKNQGYVRLERTDSPLRDLSKSPECHLQMAHRRVRPAAVEIHNTMALVDGNDQLNVGNVCPAAQQESRSKGKEIISVQPCEPSRQPRRKMLVRNGCISPNNFVADSNIVGKPVNIRPLAEHGVNGRVVDDALPHINSSINQNHCHQHSGNSFPAAPLEGRRKDKEHIAGHAFEGDENSGRPLRNRKRVRESLMSSEEGNAVLVHGNSSIPKLSGEETGSWRSTHKDIDSCPSGSNIEISSSLGRRDQGDNTQLTGRFGRPSRIDEGENGQHELGWSPPGGILWAQSKKRRMQRTSTEARIWQGSSSNSDVSPEVVYLRTLRNSSSVRRINNAAQASGCDVGQASSQRPIEVDSLESPVVRDSPTTESANISSRDQEAHARAQQIAEDEMLARQLQEAFADEVQGRGDIQQNDADIAWALQQQENAPIASGLTHMSLPTSFVTGGSRRREPVRSFRNIITRSGSRGGSVAAASGRRRAPALGRVGRFRGTMDVAPAVRPFDGRRVQFPSYMNLDMRMDLLEVMERAVEGHIAHGHLTQVDRDFNENDYEMLLALDDGNEHHRGASLQHIDRLPVSTLQPTDISDEVCSVCLEIPTAGEVVRRLLCLHRFHKECIDHWLTIQASCPVCKSSI